MIDRCGSLRHALDEIIDECWPPREEAASSPSDSGIGFPVDPTQIRSRD
jgi:hypothetical protein